ncbi:MAG: GDSL-type esterase/lipase family protein [Verrucomicrobiales bacterium]|jgi:lysophospholipase L1-like esterase|nr:GDSL-type esterase/lipase family protein [Verrucomicrobiales bacterium]
MKPQILALLVLVPAVSAAPILQPNDLVAIAGDSITQQKIYSVYLEDYLLMCQPVPGVRALQFGSNGAGAYVLGARTPENLALFHPTVVTTMYGMNDGQYQPLNEERAAAFRQGTENSIKALRDIGVREIIVGSPSYVDWVRNPEGTRMYNQTLESLGKIAHAIARREGLVCADVHAEMGAAAAKGKAADPRFNTGGDGTHAGPGGHLMIACAFLKAMGFDGAIGTLTVDLARNRAEATKGHTILGFKDGVLEVESTRYPFCFTGDPAQTESSTANAVQYLPFNEALNRYLLVVRGLQTPRAKITWGDQSREFSAAELETGVNLAAAFIPANPFSEPFAKVDAAVREKQAQETRITWSFLANAQDLQRALPGQDALFGDILKAALEQRKTLINAAAALVVPVRHTVKISGIE